MIVDLFFVAASCKHVSTKFGHGPPETSYFEGTLFLETHLERTGSGGPAIFAALRCSICSILVVGVRL